MPYLSETAEKELIHSNIDKDARIAELLDKLAAANSLAADRMDERKDAVVRAAHEFIRNGTRITQIGGEFVTVVIENNDKSDPHYALCKAIEAYQRTTKEQG